jgi:uncharacterized protein with PQ loop repeat
MKKGLEASPGRRDAMIGRLVYVAAFIGPLTIIPQVAEIWFVDRSAKGVSLITWLSFSLLSLVWLVYGLSRRDRPLIISNSLWLLGELIVVAGAIHYDFDFL